MRAGYAQVIPSELGDQSTKYDVTSQGSFGKGESIWIWRRKQGKQPLISIFYSTLTVHTLIFMYICLTFSPHIQLRTPLIYNRNLLWATEAHCRYSIG